MKKKVKIHPPITSRQAYAIGRMLLGLATPEDLKIINRKPKKKRKPIKLKE
jgi:hypothetical protein